MFKKILLVLMAVSSTTALAGEQVWDFNSVNTSNVNYGNELTFQSNGNFSVTASAWSSTGPTDSCGTVNGNQQDDIWSCIQSAKLKSYNGGLGVLNRYEDDDQPNHAIDNTNHNNSIKPHDLDVDMVLLTFEHEVKLTGFGTGWNWSDSDASIAAYDGDNFTGFGHSNWEQILSNGWKVIDNKSSGDYTSNGNLRAFGIEDDGIYSKNWLVGAYNEAFGGLHWTDTNDAFKLSGVTAVKRPDDETSNSVVSAPATLGMFALFGLLMAYRRK